MQSFINGTKIGKDSEIKIKETLGHLKTPEVETGWEISEDLPFYEISHTFNFFLI